MGNFLGYLQWYDFVRLTTCSFCLASLYISGRRAFFNWNHFNADLKELWWIVNAFLILMLENSIENLVLNVGLGPRVILSLIISAVAFRSVHRDGGFIKDELLFKDLERRKRYD